MIISTTNTLEGYRIQNYLGIVAGQAVAGEEFLTPHDRHGYNNELEKARRFASDSMVAEARKLGANAVIGASIDFEISGEAARLVIATMSGTAVVIAAEGDRRPFLKKDTSPTRTAQDARPPRSIEAL
jgi:uncharacterized protein YbjQ (UPF0145 family)